MSNFKKGERVVRVIHVGTFKAASLVVVSHIREGAVYVEESDLRYDATTGAEIGPVLPRCHSELIRLEGE